MFVFASFWNSFANFLPKCFDKFYTSSGLNDKLSRLPGDLLLPEGVRTSIRTYVGYINYFFPHEIWFYLFSAVLAWVIIRTIVSIINEIWIG